MFYVSMPDCGQAVPVFVGFYLAAPSVSDDCSDLVIRPTSSAQRYWRVCAGHNELAAICLAAVETLGLAYTSVNGHIRVSMFGGSALSPQGGGKIEILGALLRRILLSLPFSWPKANPCWGHGFCLGLSILAGDAVSGHRFFF